MEHPEFLRYIELLREPFAIYPAPRGPDVSVNWRLKKFIYVDDTPTHVQIQDVETQKTYDLPLVLVEFANRGVLRLTREVAPWNGSFV